MDRFVIVSGDEGDMGHYPRLLYTVPFVLATEFSVGQDQQGRAQWNGNSFLSERTEGLGYNVGQRA